MLPWRVNCRRNFVSVLPCSIPRPVAQTNLSRSLPLFLTSLHVTPLFPTHTVHSPVSLIFPTLTEKEGGAPHWYDRYDQSPSATNVPLRNAAPSSFLRRGRPSRANLATPGIPPASLHCIYPMVTYHRNVGAPTKNSPLGKRGDCASVEGRLASGSAS